MQNEAGQNVDLYIPRKWCVDRFIDWWVVELAERALLHFASAAAWR